MNRSPSQTPAVPTVTALPAWDGFSPEWVAEDGSVWLSRAHRIFRADALGEPPRLVAKVPQSLWKRAAATSHLARRLLRFSCYNVVPLSENELFVSFDKSMFLFRDGRWQELEGLARPCRILRGCCALTPDGDIFFGEYFSNRERAEAVNLYRLAKDAVRAEVVRTFAPGEIRHIHGVHYDPVEGALWMLSGDLPGECRILKSSDGFKTVTVVGAGDESWRSVYLVFTDDAVYAAGDSEFDENFIYRIDRASGKRTQLAAIDGPSYYGTLVGGRAVFATSVELCPSQERPQAVIWALNAADEAIPIGSYPKDLFASRALIRLFQAGIVEFAPARGSHSAIPFTGSGLRGLNGRMLVLSLNAKG